MFYGEFLYIEFCGIERNTDEKRSSFMPKLGLKTLVMNCLRKNLDKTIKYYNVDWELNVLSEDQKVYAAADASASLEVFYALNFLNDKWHSKNVFPGVIVVYGELLPQNFLHPNIKWNSAVEVKYNHTRIRISCLDIISLWSPCADLSAYFGEYFNSRRVVTSIVGFNIILDDEFKKILDMIPRKKSCFVEAIIKISKFVTTIFILLFLSSIFACLLAVVVKMKVV